VIHIPTSDCRFTDPTFGRRNSNNFSHIRYSSSLRQSSLHAGKVGKCSRSGKTLDVVSIIAVNVLVGVCLPVDSHVARLVNSRTTAYSWQCKGTKALRSNRGGRKLLRAGGSAVPGCGRGFPRRSGTSELRLFSGFECSRPKAFTPVCLQ